MDNNYSNFDFNCNLISIFVNGFYYRILKFSTILFDNKKNPNLNFLFFHNNSIYDINYEMNIEILYIFI